MASGLSTDQEQALHNVARIHQLLGMRVAVLVVGEQQRLVFAHQRLEDRQDLFQLAAARRSGVVSARGLEAADPAVDIEGGDPNTRRSDRSVHAPNLAI